MPPRERGAGGRTALTRVLITDDNAQNLYLLESILVGNGFEVESARNGAETLEAAARTPPDLVIADILMPTMDGFELCRRWRADERFSHIPFIFYTATYTDTRDERFALSLGADRFVIKPQPPDVLMGIVRTVLDEAREGCSDTPVRSSVPQEAEVEVLREYSEVLFRKLEKKVRQLEEQIAEHRRVQEELRAQEQFLDMVVENIPDMIFVKDARDLTFVRVNRAGEELLGIRREEMVGKSDHDFFPETDAEWFTAKDRDVLSGTGVVDIPREMIVTRGRGVRVLHTKKIPVFAPSGELLYLVGISEDITDRELAKERLLESENRYRNLYNSMMDAFVEVDMAGRILEYNRSFREMLGYSAEELARMTYLEITPVRWHAMEQALVQTQILPLGYSEVYEKEYIRRDGALIPVELRTTLTVDEDGRPDGMWSIVRDITERKRAEERIRLANRKLALMTDVTYQDIQNKITGLRGYVELARQNSTDPRQAALVENERTLLASLHDLIRKTKDYQQMGIDQSRWIPVEKTIRIQHSLLGLEERVTVVSDLHGLELFCDPLIDRVFFNLIDNAVAHGGRTTRVSFDFRETPEGLVLACADDGIGIPAEEKGQVFERISAGKGKFGLFFVREFLSLSGMTIEENGVPGEGARFEIRVPPGLYRFQGERSG